MILKLNCTPPRTDIQVKRLLQESRPLSTSWPNYRSSLKGKEARTFPLNCTSSNKIGYLSLRTKEHLTSNSLDDYDPEKRWHNRRSIVIVTWSARCTSSLQVLHWWLMDHKDRVNANKRRIFHRFRIDAQRMGQPHN
jgi:hypothetical protein